MLLHDTLNVLATNANDALVVLVRHMERDRRRHLLLNQGQTLLHGFIGGSHDVNVKVVFVEAVKDDLHIALKKRKCLVSFKTDYNTIRYWVGVTYFVP